MSKLTTQQTDLELWKQDQSQKLPDSLQNVFIKDCLEYIISNKIEKLGSNTVQFSLYRKKKGDGTNIYDFSFNSVEIGDNYNLILGLGEECEKIHFILTLLSRTPDGQAVMPFLDVETKEYKEYKKMTEGKFEAWRDFGEAPQTDTLDHLLYREFTEALRVGKNFEEAMQTINLIYIQNIYV
jgi:hypothetical protein